jgi:hypothetical protein
VVDLTSPQHLGQLQELLNVYAANQRRNMTPGNIPMPVTPWMPDLASLGRDTAARNYAPRLQSEASPYPPMPVGQIGIPPERVAQIGVPADGSASPPPTMPPMPRPSMVPPVETAMAYSPQQPNPAVVAAMQVAQAPMPHATASGMAPMNLGDHLRSAMGRHPLGSLAQGLMGSQHASKGSQPGGGLMSLFSPPTSVKFGGRPADMSPREYSTSRSSTTSPNVSSSAWDWIMNGRN